MSHRVYKFETATLVKPVVLHVDFDTLFVLRRHRRDRETIPFRLENFATCIAKMGLYLLARDESREAW